MKRTICLSSLILVCVFLMYSCDIDFRSTSIYNTGRSDLYSVATNSVLGINGTSWDEIIVLEEDSKGRVLFKYVSQTNHFSGDFTYFFLICQKSDDEYAYYYEDYCFFVVRYESEATPDKIDNLKEINYWNKPLNNEKMTKSKNTFSQGQRMKDRGEELNDKFKAYLEYVEGYTYVFYQVTVDDYGRQLYFIRRIKKRTEDESLKLLESYMMILNEDESFDSETFLVKIEDLYNYNDQLHEFKKVNNWNEEP